MSDVHGSSVRRSVAVICAVLAVLIGAAALFAMYLGVGWSLPWSDRASMSPNTAAASLALGCAILFAMRSSQVSGRRMAQLLGTAVLLLAVLTALQYVLSVQFGVDALLVPASRVSAQMSPSPRTSIELTLLSLSLILSTIRASNARRWAEALALLSLVLPLLALVGHVYAMQALYGITAGNGMAPQTAIAAIALSVALLCIQQGSGVLDLLGSPRPGGALARRVLPAVLVVPVVLGWLQIQGYARGLYDTESGVAGFVIATIGFFALLIWVTARRLEHEYRLRHEAESQFRAVAEGASDGIVVIDHGDRVRYMNGSAESLFDTRAPVVLGRDIGDLLRPSGGTALSSLATGRTVEMVGRRAAGEFPVDVSAGVAVSGSGSLTTLIVRDISERKRIEEELRQRALQLEEANEELEAFAYSASHDLRAPIRSIDGFTHLLIEECSLHLSDTCQRYLQFIATASRNMRELLEGLLSLAKVSRSQRVMTRVDLAELARSVVSQLQPTESGRHVEVQIPDSLWAQADASMMRSLLQNLLGNALKYTAGTVQARIEFGADMRDGQRIYFIRDNGVGFDAANADRLFKPFQRLHADSEFAGIGIGLATVKRIIERHGGAIWAHSEPGISTTFSFTLGSPASRPSSGMPPGLIPEPGVPV